MRFSYEPNDWSFLKPLKLPSKPKPVLCESPPSINHKPPPRGIHSANPPIMPHGGWAKVKKKSPLRKKVTIRIFLKVGRSFRSKIVFLSLFPKKSEKMRVCGRYPKIKERNATSNVLEIEILTLF